MRRLTSLLTGLACAGLLGWLLTTPARAAEPVNLALNLTLIPRYGAWGAAWATVVAFFIVMVGVLVAAERSMGALNRASPAAEAIPAQVP